MTKFYFASDGGFGKAENVVIVDTAQWSEEDWDAVRFSRPEDRLRMVMELTADDERDLASKT